MTIANSTLPTTSTPGLDYVPAVPHAAPPPVPCRRDGKLYPLGTCPCVRQAPAEPGDAEGLQSLFDWIAAFEACEPTFARA